MSEKRTQFEQENDLGRGGGEVDDETLEQAWRDADARRGREDAAADAEVTIDAERGERSA